MSLPAIGIVHADGTATLSRDEVAWIREVFSRVSTAFGESKSSPRGGAGEEEIRTHALRAATYSAARHVAEGEGVAVAFRPEAVNALGEVVDLRSPYLVAMRHRVEITVLRGGLPPAPEPSWEYATTGRIEPRDLTLEVPAIQEIPGLPLFGEVRG